MSERRLPPPPRWLFAVVLAGSCLACGIYLGLIRAEGAATGHVVRVAVYAVLAVFMLWGTLGKR
ncbi:MAG: hypothetical protein ACYTG3_12720 [Planctomycetota bacterium]|jgi:hypothetical protein